MVLKELSLKVEAIIKDLKDNGRYPNENNLIDYKLELNISESKNSIENFLINFAKDILSFANSDGGIILIGIKEDKINGLHEDTGLNEKNINLLNQIDLNDLSQKFDKIAKLSAIIDIQQFQISTRKFFYLIIEKSDTVLVPVQDFLEYKIYKGSIIYRLSGKNEHANISTSKFNQFIQIKANERSKEFMEIWSKLLPEMVDINPREVLILNPIQNKIYGFNNRDKVLSSSDIEIDKSEKGPFNIILNAITAGEIGKITTDKGKPIFKIVGEFQGLKERIVLSSIINAVKEKVPYIISSKYIKSIMYYLKWVYNIDFPIDNPPEGTVNPEFNKFLWIGPMDSISKRKKVLFNSVAIPELIEVINNKDLHLEIFGRELTSLKNETV